MTARMKRLLRGLRNPFTVLKAFSIWCMDLLQVTLIGPYRLFLYNTMRPAKRMRFLASKGFQPGSPHRAQIWLAILAWRTRKRDELQFVAVASTVLTAVITASFSWPNVPDAHWSCHAFWYASLTLSISDIFLSTNQLSHLSIIDPSNVIKPGAGTGSTPIYNTPSGTAVIRRHLLQLLTKVPAQSTGKESEHDPATNSAAVPHSNGSDEDLARDIEAQAGESQEKLLFRAEPDEGGGSKIRAEPNGDTLSKSSETPTKVESEKWKLNWRSILVWHCPVMVISYAAVFYMAGLFCVLAKPLFERNWFSSDAPDEIPAGFQAAIAYVWTLFVSIALFMFCSVCAPDTFETTDDEREPDER